jgi:hypothetical protein
MSSFSNVAVAQPQPGYTPPSNLGMFGNFFGSAIAPVANQVAQQAGQPAATTVTPTAMPTTTAVTPTVIPGGSPSELSAARGAASGESRIDPRLAPYLQMGLQRAERLFFGDPQPSLYPGQMYVSPSQQTEQALAMQEQLASAASPFISAGQQGYLSSLGQIGQTAAGGFLQGNPYQQAMLAAATRPLTQQYGEQIVPGIASLYSRAGRYGSGSMERALSGATEAYGRALGDVATNIVGQDYARERGLQQQAQLGQAALAQAAPSFYQSSFLPAQTLAQVGAAREAIAAKPLQEAIQRYQYSQQLPYQQLQGFLSSVYGTPMGSSQYAAQPAEAKTNYLTQGLGGALLGSQVGSMFGGIGGLSGSQTGAILGGLGGLLL